VKTELRGVAPPANFEIARAILAPPLAEGSIGLAKSARAGRTALKFLYRAGMSMVAVKANEALG
jgi:hypothetical protein